jgi:hypothetical protein
MPDAFRRVKDGFQKNLKVTASMFAWLLALFAVVFIGVSLGADLSGQSRADQFVLARWSVEGLRAYLWLEGGLLAGFVSALGVHVISNGLTLTRGAAISLFGMPHRRLLRVPSQLGYVFVVLGSALIALSLATLLLLNSCRYMRLI